MPHYILNINGIPFTSNSEKEYVDEVNPKSIPEGVHTFTMPLNGHTLDLAILKGPISGSYYIGRIEGGLTAVCVPISPNQIRVRLHLGHNQDTAVTLAQFVNRLIA